MLKCPNVGDRVRFVGEASWAKGHDVVGEVTRVWKRHDDDWDEDEDRIIPGPLKPEDEWSVSVRLDEVPPNFPYKSAGDGKTFAPGVWEVEPL